MAFSSQTTPQATQMEDPDAPWFSISVDPQFGQNALLDDIVRLLLLILLLLLFIGSVWCGVLWCISLVLV
jgi:hypothetical protein